MGRSMVSSFGLWIVLLTAPLAQAHDPFVWFEPLGWDDHTDIDYRIDDSIPGDPGSNFEDRIHDGVAEWNAVTGVGGFTYVDAGNGNESWGDPCNWKNDAVDVWVFFHDIASSGLTSWCPVYHRQRDYTDIHAARAAFDSALASNLAWYRGTGDVPSGEVSVWEVSAHEFGHVTGVYLGGNNDAHWPAPPSNQCASGGAQSDYTMCPTNYAGEDYQIPLDAHDIDTFQNFY